MNYIEFWLNEAPVDNILIYNCEEYNKEHFNTSIETTTPNIIIIYNNYLINEEKDIIIKETLYPHYFYIKSEKNLMDAGLIILSNYGINIYSNKNYVKIVKRISNELIFSIKNYYFKIDMDNSVNIDGYYIYFKYINGNKKIKYSKKKIDSKIILLKANANKSFKE